MTDHEGSAPDRLRTGQVAAAAGVNVQTLRYYERRGLLTEPDRSLGGHRLYPAEAVTVLRVIKAAQRLGFTLDEVAELLEAGGHRHGGAPVDALRARARTKLAEVEAKIDDLRVIATTLHAAIDAGCDDLLTCAGNPRCPVPFAQVTIHTGGSRSARTPAGASDPVAAATPSRRKWLARARTGR